MEIKCTIVIPVSEESDLLAAVEAQSKGGDIIVEKLGRSDVTTNVTGVEQAYYTIIFKNAFDQLFVFTSLFQIGQSVAYMQAGQMVKA